MAHSSRDFPVGQQATDIELVAGNLLQKIFLGRDGDRDDRSILCVAEQPGIIAVIKAAATVMNMSLNSVCFIVGTKIAIFSFSGIAGDADICSVND